MVPVRGDWLRGMLDGLADDPLDELFRKSDDLTPPHTVLDINEAAEAILAALRARDVAKLSREEVAGEPGSLYLGGTLHRCSWATADSSTTLWCTELARAVLDPQLGPHAALTWRSAGLFYSKKDEYVLANAYFEEAVDRLSQWGRNEEVQRSYQFLRGQRDGAAAANPDAELAEMHEETYEQILLGQTGTAARTVEHVLTQWDSRSTENERERRLVFYRLYKTTRQAVEFGEGAAGRLQGLHTAARRTLKRLAVQSWRRRPGVMTARSHLLAVPLCRVLQDLHARHPVHGDNWGSAIDEHRSEFLRHYSTVVSPLVDEEGNAVPADDDHLREIAQLRLTHALVFDHLAIDPGTALDANVVGDRCLRDRWVDIDAHAYWLRDHPGRNGNPSDANLIASIVCSHYTDALRGLPKGLSYPNFIRKYPWLPREAAVKSLERIVPGLAAARRPHPRT